MNEQVRRPYNGVSLARTRRVFGEELAARALFAILAAGDLEKKQTHTEALLSDPRRRARAVAGVSCTKLSQNSVQEGLTKLWIGRCLRHLNVRAMAG